ncbi:hypothetical protein LSAT2_024541 [Lamellibrachia satsuma]|nr:hypothetical protein LSAT2_024541 [Lamellibrachia satsuma]
MRRIRSRSRLAQKWRGCSLDSQKNTLDLVAIFQSDVGRNQLIGTYQPTAGEAECIKCSPGKSTAEEGAQNDDQCKDVEVPSNTTFIIGGSVGGLLLLLLLSCIVYTVYRRRSGPTKDAPDPQAGQHHGSGDNPTPALLQTCRTTSDIYEEIDDERTGHYANS